MMRFVPFRCPECGKPAFATVEKVYGHALLTDPDDDGRVEFLGETEISWDSQETLVVDDHVTLACRNGHEWMAEDLDGSFHQPSPTVPGPAHDPRVARPDEHAAGDGLGTLAVYQRWIAEATGITCVPTLARIEETMRLERPTLDGLDRPAFRDLALRAAAAIGCLALGGPHDPRVARPDEHAAGVARQTPATFLAYGVCPHCRNCEDNTIIADGHTDDGDWLERWECGSCHKTWEQGYTIYKITVQTDDFATLVTTRA